MSTSYLQALLDGPEFESPNPEVLYERLEREEAELEEALLEACDTDPVVGLRVAPLLQRFWFARGRLERGRAWVERLLASAGDAPTVDRARGLSAAAALAFRQGDNDATRRYASEARELALEQRASEVQIDAALALARVGLRDGNVANVRRFSEEAREVALELGDEARELRALHHLAEGTRIAGDHAHARGLYEESLARNRARGSRVEVSVELTNLATLDKTEGNFEQAEANLCEAIEISQEIGNSYVLAANLVVLGVVAAAAGQPERATRFLGHADAIYSATGLVIDPADKPEYDNAVAVARSALGEKRFAAAHARGAEMPVELLLERD